MKVNQINNSSHDDRSSESDVLSRISGINSREFSDDNGDFNTPDPPIKV